MTCDKCLQGRHIRCSGPCSCNICAKRSSGNFVADEGNLLVKERKKARRQAQPRKVRVTPEGAKAVMTDRQANKVKYGVWSDLNDDEIQKVFTLKAQGESLSEIARQLDTTRDKVRTIYHCPSAPEAGTKAFEPLRYTGGRLTGNEHLDKAKGALEHARDLVHGLDPETEIQDNPKLHKQYLSLLDLASVQASLAQAEALTRIAAVLEKS